MPDTRSPALAAGFFAFSVLVCRFVVREGLLGQKRTERTEFAFAVIRDAHGFRFAAFSHVALVSGEDLEQHSTEIGEDRSNEKISDGENCSRRSFDLN
jgi:hypothetical protein